jgi:hypothetical protein
MIRVAKWAMREASDVWPSPGAAVETAPTARRVVMSSAKRMAMRVCLMVVFS